MTPGGGAPTLDIPLDCPRPSERQSDALSKSANQAQDMWTKDALVCP